MRKQIDNKNILLAGQDINIKHLTKREKEYLSLMALGFTNYQIAFILSVTDSTVKKTLESIYNKLYASNRPNAIMIAILYDILTYTTIFELVCSYKEKIFYSQKSGNYSPSNLLLCKFL